eukprot:scaffold245156_cov19-Prasinocladus_malaysianus.AAC.1
MGDSTPPERFSYEKFEYEDGLGQITAQGIQQVLWFALLSLFMVVRSCRNDVILFNIARLAIV